MEGETMKRCKVLPAIVLLLLAAGASTSFCGEPPRPDDSEPGIEAGTTAAVGELIRLRATGAEVTIDAPESAPTGRMIDFEAIGGLEGDRFCWTIYPATVNFRTAGRRAMLSTEAGGPMAFNVTLSFVLPDGSPYGISKEVTIGDGPPAPDARITVAMVHKWLELVPAEVRNETIKDPITGETYTRQQAVGMTFADVGSAAKALGSIRATNVMLTTGLAAAFGSEAKEWESFAETVDAALAAEEKRGVSSAEYGKILGVIGGALR